MLVPGIVHDPVLLPVQPSVPRTFDGSTTLLLLSFKTVAVLSSTGYWNVKLPVPVKAMTFFTLLEPDQRWAMFVPLPCSTNVVVGGAVASGPWNWPHVLYSAGPM